MYSCVECSFNNTSTFLGGKKIFGTILIFLILIFLRKFIRTVIFVYFFTVVQVGLRLTSGQEGGGEQADRSGAKPGTTTPPPFPHGGIILYIERKRGVNCIKAADGLPWSTCEQGFVSRREIL